jgi:trans-aconitate 2-methyltransferase
MLERAAGGGTGIEWVEADVSTWAPESNADLIFSNAALHWLDDHPVLFPRLAGFLTSGGVLAVQMPDNWNAPTHRIPAEILDEGGWPEDAHGALLRDRLSPPGMYATLVGTDQIDIWRTTYFQRLTGADPVWEWVIGSVLRPVLASMRTDDRARFTAECKRRYRDSYPPGADGVTTLAFSRLFLVGQAG